MKISFNTNNLNGLSLSQFFLLLYIETSNNSDKNNKIDKDYQFFMDNGFINDYREITDTGKDVLRTILSNTNEEEMNSLVNELREIYPKGVMPGTNYKWTSNPKEITDKLKRFLILFNKENITPDEIIQATKNYVKKMEYSPYMRLLKYFILKNNADHDKESDLYSEICLIREGNNIEYENHLI